MQRSHKRSEGGRGGIPLRKRQVLCSDDVADSRLRIVGLLVRLPANVSRYIAGHVIPVFMLRGIPPRPPSAVLAPLRGNKSNQNSTNKARYFRLHQYRSGCFFYPRMASKAEVPGTSYRISGTLEFSSCASIASPRRPLFERAKRESLGRRGDNKRRSKRSTKFHLVPRFCMVFPALRTFSEYSLYCYLSFSTATCCSISSFSSMEFPGYSTTQSHREVNSSRVPITSYPNPSPR